MDAGARPDALETAQMQALGLPMAGAVPPPTSPMLVHGAQGSPHTGPPGGMPPPPAGLPPGLPHVGSLSHGLRHRGTTAL